jgi:hypothetical protein
VNLKVSAPGGRCAVAIVTALKTIPPRSMLLRVPQQPRQLADDSPGGPLIRYYSIR